MIAGTRWDRGDALARALTFAEEAAAIVMGVYAAPFDVDYKGPNDPVTRADREANALLCARLQATFPGVPIVAEESDPATYAGYGAAPAVWFVDPLDGTREFVAKNGQFAVMVGLAEGGRATGGVIVCPALGRAFVGGEGVPAYEVVQGARRPIRVSGVASMKEARVVVSRSRRSEALERVLAHLGAREVIPTGSSGLKGALVAAGEADVYAHFGPAGKRWDSCATEALIRAAGGVFTTTYGELFEYASGDLENRRGFLGAPAPLHEAMLEGIRQVLGST